MTITPSFALIGLDSAETGFLVKNRIVCDDIETATQLAIAAYGSNAKAHEITFYPVTIGDLYINGSFFRKMADDQYEQIVSSGSYQDMITRLEAQNAEMAEELQAALDAICELYEMLSGSSTDV